MTKSELTPRTAESIGDEIARWHEAIRQRAFELFEGGDGKAGELDNWLEAEKQICPRPAMQMRRVDGKFEIEAAVPGVDAKDLNIQATSDAVLITGARETKAKSEKGDQGEETCSLRYFGEVHFPEPIDPKDVKAEYREGLLKLTAAVAKPLATKVEVRA
jgi:HSP20 family protein